MAGWADIALSRQKQGGLYGGGNNESGYGGSTYGGAYGPLAGQTFYADPNAAGGLIQQLIANMTGQQGQFNQFMQNPAASPAFQARLSGLLGALQPSEQQGATQLQDMFRSAGNTASSVFGQAANQYQGDVMRNRQELASKLLGQTIQQQTAAMLPQILQGPQLLEAMRLSQQYRAPQQQQQVVSSGGGEESSNQLDQLLKALSGNQQFSRGGQLPLQTQQQFQPQPQPQQQNTIPSAYYNPNMTSYSSDVNPVQLYMPEGGSVENIEFYPQEAAVTPENNWPGMTEQDWSNLYGE